MSTHNPLAEPNGFEWTMQNGEKETFQLQRTVTIQVLKGELNYVSSWTQGYAGPQMPAQEVLLEYNPNGIDQGVRFRCLRGNTTLRIKE